MGMGLPDCDGETPLFDGLGSERTVTNIFAPSRETDRLW